MIKSLIINPPFLEPHRPPISCAILAEVLRLQDHDATVVDINIEIFRKLGSDAFHALQVEYTTGQKTETTVQLDRLINNELHKLNFDNYEWILISCFSFWNVEITELICRLIRPHTNAKIVVGGPGIEYSKKGPALVSAGLIDYYVHGEGELSIVNLVNGHIESPGINGIPPQQIDVIENLPLPNYSYFDLSRYDWLLDSPDVFIYGSRGCVRKCTFCDVENYWSKFRYRSGASIAQEMIDNYEKLGITNFFFADSLVNGNLKEFQRMCEILAGYKENLFRWGSYAIVRPKASHPASLFDLIKASGGRFWSIGIETGVDRIRWEMDKKFTNQDIDWHLEQSQRIGLQNNFLNIPTWPSETLDEHCEYLEMFKRWRPYAVDGTIYGIKISTTLGILNNTRLWKKQGQEFIFDSTVDRTTELQAAAWKVPHNPDLTHKEKFRRTIALYEAAIDNNWPLTNQLQSLHELRSTIISWKSATDNQTSQHIIPITKLKNNT
jgi:hypothetical protein